MSSFADQPIGAAPKPGPQMAPVSSSAPDAIKERIAREVASLDDLREVPLAGHADAYQRVHGELQRALAEIDGA